MVEKGKIMVANVKGIWYSMKLQVSSGILQLFWGKSGGMVDELFEGGVSLGQASDPSKFGGVALMTYKTMACFDEFKMYPFEDQEFYETEDLMNDD